MNLYCTTGPSPTRENFKEQRATDQETYFRLLLIQPFPSIPAKLDFRLKTPVKTEPVDFKMLFEKLIWNLNDLNQATGLSKQTIYNLVNQGRIPHSRKARRLFFSPTEIQNWIEEGELNEI
jgi:predicted DNA-binding transcriptional regulator AlpA